MIFSILIACAITITSSIAGQSPQLTNPAGAENKASANKPPVEILSHKIAPEYYPILDQKSSVAPPTSAETGDLPRMRNDPLPRHGKFDVPPEERREQGRLRSSYSGVPGHPQLIQVSIKNTSAKSIKAVEWDFLFPHCENGRYVPRYDVTTRVKINPGGQKTLKRRLSPVVSLCDMPKVISIDELRKQERISIKRIEYVDGSAWQRQ